MASNIRSQLNELRAWTTTRLASTLSAIGEPGDASRTSPELEQDERAEATPTAARADARWLILMLVLALGMAALLLLRVSYGMALVAVLIAACLALAVSDAGLTPLGAARQFGAVFVGAWRFLRDLRRADDEGRARAAALFAGIALACMVVAAAHFQPEADDALLDDGLIWMIGGAIALGGALRLTRDRIETPARPSAAALTPERSHWGVIAVGVLLIAFVVAVNIDLFGVPLLDTLSIHLQFALFAAGLGLVVWGFGGLPALTLPRVDRREALVVGAILAVAFALRAIGLDVTVRWLIDEIQPIHGLQQVWWNPNAGLVSTHSSYLPPSLLYFYWDSILVSIFGRNLVGLRMVSAVAGTLNVLAMYLLARALFNRRFAVIAALILATFPPHLHFSRQANWQIADALFGTLLFAFMVRGLKSNRRLDWALAGASLGLAQYFYEAGRLLFPPLYVGTIAAMIILIPGRLRAHWRGLAVSMIVALLVTVPIYATMFAQENSRTMRFDDSGLGPDYWQNLLADGISPDEARSLFDRLTLPLKIYVHQPDMSLFYGGDQPLVIEYLVPLFLLGVAYLLWNLRAPTVFALLWLIAVALGNTVVRDSGHVHRYVLAFPALALTLALGLRYGLTLLWRGPLKPALAAAIPDGAAPRRIGRVLTAVAVAAVCLGQVVYYFGPHLQLYNRQFRDYKPYPDTVDAALRSTNFPPGTAVIFISTHEIDIHPPRNLLDFMGVDVTVNQVRAADVTPEYINALPRDRSYAFFIEPGHPQIVAMLSGAFPLQPPQGTTFPIPADKVYPLYFAPQASG